MPELAGRGERDPDDYYATTPQLAALICATVKRDFSLQTPSSILEPSCGAGTFLSAIRSTWPGARASGIEVHDDLAAYARDGGFDVALGDTLHADLGSYDLIIGNPPFRHAEAFIPLLLKHLRPRGVLAFILRLNFLATQERYGTLWSIHTPTKVDTLVARPGFTPNGHTDGTDYMVCAWQEGHVGPATLGFIDNRFVKNRWKNAGVFPDPRGVRTPKPDAVLVSPAGTLSEWEAEGAKARAPRAR